MERGRIMVTLIKRDLQSTKNVWLFVLLALIVVWAFLYYLILWNSAEISELLMIPAFLNLYFGYGLVAHVCRVENLNRVNERVLQLPIHFHVLIMSRYLTSFLLVGILLLLNLTMLVPLYFLRESIVNLSEISSYIYLLAHLMIFIILIYLPFYFAKNSHVATWATRTSIVLWLMYIFLFPEVYARRVYDQFLPDVFYDHLVGILLLATLIILPISFASSIWSYRLKRQLKRILLPLISLCLCIVILFAGIAKIAESKTLTSIAEILMDTKVEKIAVDAFLAYHYKEGETPEKYRLFISLEFTNENLLNQRRMVTKDATISITVTGDSHTYLGLNSFGSPLEFILSRGHYLGLNEEGRERYGYEIEAPNFLSLEEKNAYLEQFNDQDFTVYIESDWLKDTGTHTLKWADR